VSNRITFKDLESLVTRINKVTDSPLTPYTKHADGSFTPNGGNYHLDGAYGGYQLQRMCRDGSTGTENVLRTGHLSKPELYRLMSAFCAGLETKETENE